jgi:hypothetical protein
MNYSELDPGIRETVRRLNDLGFETTDSGDGETKLAAGWSPDEARDVPHVCIRSKAGDLCMQADRLVRELTRAGMCVEPVGHSGIFVQATYDPADGTAVIELIGVSDRSWP